MQPESFVKELAAMAPSAASLEESGFSPAQAREFIKSFQCAKRTHPLETLRSADPLLDLLAHWDLSKVVIGMIRFPEPPSSQAGYIYVGCVEADPLVISLATGEVIVHDLDNHRHVLWTVAANGSMFLDAIIIAARFLEKRGAKDPNDDDNDEAHFAASQSATAAGGEKYLSFYRMLVGAE